MKRGAWLAASISTLLTMGCSSGGSGSAATCPAGESFAGAKVQLIHSVAATPEDSFFGVQAASAISAAYVKQGTVLTAVVKNHCESPGEIVSRLQIETAAAAKDGARSYPFRLERDMPKAELESMAAADPCLLGLADSTVDGINGLPTDPMVGKQAHLSELGAAEALPVFYDASLGKRAQVVIAIVDTGVDLAHEDLRETLWTNPGEVAGNGVDDDQNGYVDDVHGYNFAGEKADPSPQGKWTGNYHGTHVAGLAAAKGGNEKGVSGIMGAGARIMALNVFGPAPGAFNYHTENAIRYAADNGADVINLSIGGSSGSASYEAAIQYAVSRGVSVFAAAGNERRPLGKSHFVTPGAYAQSIDGMMAVGSVDSADGEWSLFSNYGADFVEIAAPGSEDSRRFLGLLSTMPGNLYARLQGTSMSTPIVSGAAALTIQLLRARGYAATPQRIESILADSAKTVGRLAEKVRAGRVMNLKNIADFILGSYPPLASPEPEIYRKPGAGLTHTLVPCP